MESRLTSHAAGYVFNYKSDPEDKTSAFLVVKYEHQLPLTTAVLATSRPVDDVDLVPFLEAVRIASVDPMVLPEALVDLVISSEASGTVSIDKKLSQLEAENSNLLESASVASTTTVQAERTAKTLNAVRSALGRSERRLQSLRYLLGTCRQYMHDLRSMPSIPNSLWDMDTAQRVLQAHNANMRGDIEHLLLQVQNNNARVQTQQQVVSSETR